MSLETFQTNGQPNNSKSKIQNPKSHASAIAKFFFTRSVFATILCCLFIIGGLMGYQSMIKEADPDINIARAMITTEWAGADPETIENQITDKIEKELKSLKGLKQVKSASFNSFSLIDVEFRAEAPVTESIQLVRSKVDDAEPELPDAAEKPKVEHLSVQDAPVLTVALYGKLDPAVLSQAAEDLQERLEKVPNVREVELSGRREALDFYGISQSDLAWQGRYNMTDNDIGDFPVGGGEEDLEIRLSTAWPSRGGDIGGPTQKDELSTVRIFRPNQETVASQSVLDEVRGEAPLSITHRNTNRTVTVLAKTEPGYTDGEIVAALEPKLQAMQKKWPKGYTYKFAGDAETQGETFGSAGQMLIVAMFLVFGMLVLQFSSFTQPFIIMLTIPFALIGMFGGFFLLGIPFSFPAMVGLISLVGIVVNNAIIMIETMNDYRREGMDVRRSAAQGAADRMRPILSTSISAIVGLIPLALSDPLWMPLCNTIIFGLTASTAIALLVVPGLYLQLTPPNKCAT